MIDQGADTQRRSRFDIITDTYYSHQIVQGELVWYRLGLFHLGLLRVGVEAAGITFVEAAFFLTRRTKAAGGVSGKADFI